MLRLSKCCLKCRMHHRNGCRLRSRRVQAHQAGVRQRKCFNLTRTAPAPQSRRLIPHTERNTFQKSARKSFRRHRCWSSKITSSMNSTSTSTRTSANCILLQNHHYRKRLCRQHLTAGSSQHRLDWRNLIFKRRCRLHRQMYLPPIQLLGTSAVMVPAAA